MTITSLAWFGSPNFGGEMGARDIHLTRRLSSPRLDQLLFVYTTANINEARRVDRPPPAGEEPWTLSFIPSYVRPPGRQYREFNYGVSVDTGTGEVTVDTALPAGPRLYSFIVTATVTQGTTQLRARIRVHVHDHVTAKWLTPSSLTVRQGATGMRFSVLATFDDGVIGDITNWAPLESTPAIPGDRTCVHAVGSDAPAHRWSAGTGSDIGMTVDPVTGEIRSQQPGGFVTVNLIDAGGTAASATAFAAPPWSTPVQLRRVAGLGFPALPRTDIHNVLFIPDGFVQDILGTDRLEYELYVNELVHQMNTNAQTRPYDVLSEKFNYFSAWVPSPQAGVSAMAEMFSVDPPDPNNHHVRGWDVDTPRHPLPGPEPFTVNELIDLVGLPTPANDPPGSPVGTDAAGRVHDWHQVNSAQVTAARVPAVDPEDVYNLWLAQNTRVLVNERDTAFHVAAGSRPRIDLGRTAEVELGFHPLRLTSADFNTFLKALQDDQGNPLPPVWAEGGKDDRLVVIICRTTRHSGQNNGRGAIRADGRGAAYLCVPVGSTFTRTYVAAGKGFDLVPDPIPAKVDPGPWAIMAHELAHSFGLGDEYAYPGRLHEGEGPEVQKYTNLQESAALHTPNGRLVATNIKWRLKRLRQAGVLRAEQPNVDPVRPDPSSAGRFVITLRRGHAAAFVDPQADVVRLRTPGPRTNPRYSDRLRLVGVRGNQLTVRPLSGSQFNPGEWRTGDLVVAPVRGADPDYQNDLLGPDLELVHKDVVDRINATSNPLNAMWDAPLNRPCSTPVPDDEPRDEYRNYIGRPKRPRLLNRTVGLYEGGYLVECGVYHPTGQCMMNLGYQTTGAGVAIADPFCPVCRYLMVDLIDPSKHGLIDRDYDYEYPA